jgi:hypothetical protein
VLTGLKELKLPGLELADLNADYSGTQTVFVDFDGAEGVSYDNEALNIHIGGLSVADSGLSQIEQLQILSDLNTTFAGTGVTFTIDVTGLEPETYSTIYVGGNDSAFSEYGNFQGLSETIDAGNQIKNDEAFVFSDNINSTTTITKTIVHEAGHLLGYQHEENETENDLDITDYASQLTSFTYTLTGLEYYSLTGDSNGFDSDYSEYSLNIGELSIGDFQAAYRFIIPKFSNGVESLTLSIDADEHNVLGGGTNVKLNDISGSIGTINRDNNPFADDYTIPLSALKDGGDNYYLDIIFDNSGYDNINIESLNLTVTTNSANTEFELVQQTLTDAKLMFSQYLSDIIPSLEDSSDIINSVNEIVQEGIRKGYAVADNLSSIGGFKISDIDINNPTQSFGVIQDIWGTLSGAWNTWSSLLDLEEYMLTPLQSTLFEDTETIVSGMKSGLASSINSVNNLLTYWKQAVADNIISISEADNVYQLAGNTESALVNLDLQFDAYFDKIWENFLPFQNIIDIDSVNKAVNVLNPYVEHYVFEYEQTGIPGSWYKNGYLYDLKEFASNLKNDVYSFVPLDLGTNGVMKLTASNGSEYDYFGSSLAVANNRIIAGAIGYEYNPAIIVPPGEEVNVSLLFNSGLAYAYDYNGNSFDEYIIEASDKSGNGYFGYAVAAFNDIVIIGAPGNYQDGIKSGSAYVYHWTGSSYDEYKLTPSNGEPGGCFGASVAISGEIIVVGASETSNNGENTGSVYIYSQNDNNFDEYIIEASDGNVSDYFGYSVAISDNTIVVGAPGSDETGGVYIYEWNDGSSYNEYKITAPDLEVEDCFGYSLAISDDTIVVGSPNTDQTGAIYIYKWNETNCDCYKLLASDGTDYDLFGSSVAISGNTIVVGAHNDDAMGTSSGSVYVYHWNGSGYDEYKLTAPDGAVDDFFGFCVAISNNVIAVSCDDDDSGEDSGSVYLFNMSNILENYASTSAEISYINSFSIEDSDVRAEVTGLSENVVYVGGSLGIGTELTVNWTAVNDGAVDVGGWTAAIVLTRDSVLGNEDDILLGTEDIDVLAAGEYISGNSTVTIAAGTPVGDYHVELIADYNNDIPESFGGESNNTLPTNHYTITVSSDNFAAVPNNMNVEISDNDVTLSWYEVADVSGVLRYEYYLDDNPDFSSPIAHSGTTEKSFNVSDLADGTYYWQVCTCDNLHNYSDWQQGESFVVDMTPPSKPAGLSSDPLEEFPGYYVLSWQNSTDNLSGIKSYLIQTDDNYNFDSPDSVYLLAGNGNIVDTGIYMPGSEKTVGVEFGSEDLTKYYKLQLTEAAIIILQGEYTPNGINYDDLNISVYDGTGSLVNGFNPLRGWNEGIGNRLEAGTYFIELESQSAGTSGLSILTCSLDEPGNNALFAYDFGTLSGDFKVNYSDTVSPADRDYFEFTLTEKTDLHLSIVENPVDGIYSDIYWEVILKNQISGEYDESLLYFSQDPQECFVSLDAGTYYIGVNNGDFITDYSLMLEKENFQSNPGFSLATAFDTGVYTPRSEKALAIEFCSENLTRYYQVQLTETSRLMVQGEYMSGGISYDDLNISVYDGAGTLVNGFNPLRGWGDGIGAQLGAGTYFIELESQSAGISGISIAADSVDEPGDNALFAYNFGTLEGNFKVEYSGTVSPVDLDYFEFTLTEKTAIHLNIVENSIDGTYTDIYWEIVSKAQNPDSYDEAIISCEEPQEYYSSLDAGTYYISLNESSVSSGYSLTLESEDSESVSGFSMATAFDTGTYEIDSAKIISAEFTDENLTKYYKLQLTETAQIILENSYYYYQAISLDELDISIYDANGILVEGFIPLRGWNPGLGRELQAGTYFVELHSPSAGNSQFFLSAESISEPGDYSIFAHDFGIITGDFKLEYSDSVSPRDRDLFEFTLTEKTDIHLSISENSVSDIYWEIRLKNQDPTGYDDSLFYFSESPQECFASLDVGTYIIDVYSGDMTSEYNLVLENYPLSENNTNVISNPGSGTYYWRVKAVDNAGNESDWSTIESFGFSSHRKNDFDGNSRSDVISYLSDTGHVKLYLNGADSVEQKIVGGVDAASWDYVGTGDFNSDGATDVLWRNKSTGLVGAWLLNKGSGDYSSWSSIAGAAIGEWEISGVGDFNGDGTDDVLWYNTQSGLMGAWLVNDGVYSAWTSIAGADPSSWSFSGIGDFNNDNMDDILWCNNDTGLTGAWLLDNGAYSAWTSMAGADLDNWSLSGVGDFNADGTDDVLWCNKDTGLTGAWLLGNGAYSAWTSMAGADLNNWKLEGVGDYNGDGTDDVLWCNNDSGLLGYWQIENGQYTNWATIA